MSTADTFSDHSANIAIEVETQYIGQSKPNDNKHAFSYTITISNDGDETVQLLSRHWIISDGNNEVEEVHGSGVVGQTPIIPAGESFTYSSGALIKTEQGTMEGSYQFIDHSNNPFEVQIPIFRLSVDGVLH